MRAARPVGTLRVSAGRWKGRRLEIPPGARPTSARAREALFDILGSRIAGARVLDLYAGSGAVGIEAVSRGAAAAVLVERDARTLRRNLERIGAGPEVEVLESSTAEGVRLLSARKERFDVTFSDPPYAAKKAERIRGVAGLLAPDGVLILQRDAEAQPPRVEGLVLVGERAYGRNRFHFFERE